MTRNPYILASGSHAKPEDGRCAMEWVAYLAGERHSATPRCVSPVLRRFGISINDSLSNKRRQRLRPYLARMIGTQNDGLDDARQWMCTDWLIREHAPAWLDLVPNLVFHASALRSLPPVLGIENLNCAMVSLNAARNASRRTADRFEKCTTITNLNAARALAQATVRETSEAAMYVRGDESHTKTWPAARIIVGDAVEDAMEDAARVVAGVGVAAGITAGIIAWGTLTPGIATWGALAPVLMLEDSILRPGGLLDRMLPMEAIQLPIAENWHEICGIAK